MLHIADIPADWFCKLPWWCPKLLIGNDKSFSYHISGAESKGCVSKTNPSPALRILIWAFTNDLLSLLLPQELVPVMSKKTWLVVVFL